MSTEPLRYSELADMPTGRLTGVGPSTATGLGKLGIESLLDLLHHFPRRYIDRSNPRRIRDLREGENALVLATLDRVESRRTRTGKMMVSVTFSDASGRLRCSFFNQPWRQRQLETVEGSEVAVFGRVEMFNGKPQMANPLVDLIGDQTGRIVPIYPLSDKVRVTSADLASLVAQTLRRSAQRGMFDPVPVDVLKRYGLKSRADAFGGIHFPGSMGEMVNARNRLVFDELLRIQLALVGRKRQIERESRGISHQRDTDGARAEDLLGALYDSLPYELTGAQRRAVAEITTDLISTVPMHRLLQGDVGAGKTLVALIALMTVIQAGHQGAFMAPTEVLAEQHAHSLRGLVDGLELSDGDSLLGVRPLTVGLLTGSTRAAERRRILDDLSNGRIDILVGTHALIEDSVQFRSLGLVVVDEQHRFGVEQRDSLRSSAGQGSGQVPDVLVMTATPIPRTAAMTVYGDLDMTVLDELPPGRTPIMTTWARSAEDEASAWELVRSQVGAGRQAYVVCPLVEGSDKIEAASAQDTFDRLRASELSGLELGLIHGRMSSEDKDSVMSAFRANKVDVLVSTTVIEVGVDVANSTVMVILDADRFGLAQLHQLRGRVGRGGEQSHCVLVAPGELSPESTARLEAMVATTDGFALAEIDLELRGAGTIMGERQKGRSDLKLTSLSRDAEWVARAREVAFELVDDPGHSDSVASIEDEIAVLIREQEVEFLEKG